MLLLQCLDNFYSCNVPFIERLHKGHDAQQLCINHFYVNVHPTAARRVCNDNNLQNADDAGSTVSMHVHNDAKMYQPSNLWIERDDEFTSQLKEHYDPTDDGH